MEILSGQNTENFELFLQDEIDGLEEVMEEMIQEKRENSQYQCSRSSIFQDKSDLYDAVDLQNIPVQAGTNPVTGTNS